MSGTGPGGSSVLQLSLPQGAESQPGPGGVPAAAGDGSGGAARLLRQFRRLQVSRQRFASVAA